MRTTSALLALSLTVVLPACGSSKPSTRARGKSLPPPSAWHHDPVTSPHPECPTERHLVAAARSTESAEDAEQQARGALARQISSTIEVQVDNVVQAVVSGDEAHVDRSLERSVVEKSTFTKNELIRAMPPHAFDEEAGEYFALVCLDRLASRKAIEAENADAIARVDQALTSADAAAQAGDTPAFTRAYRDARRHAPQALSALALMHALRGSPDPRTQPLTERYAHVVAEASKIRHNARVTLAMHSDGMSDAQKSALVSTLRTSLEQTGLPLSVDDKPCAKNDLGRTHVDVNGTANCKWGSLGHMCKPTFVVAATACGETPRKLLESSLDGAGGVHAKDPNKALERAVAETKFDAVASELQRVIQDEVPIEE